MDELDSTLAEASAMGYASYHEDHQMRFTTWLDKIWECPYDKEQPDLAAAWYFGYRQAEEQWINQKN